VLAFLASLEKAGLASGPMADVHQLGLNLANGLPAKTLKTCRSSLRNAQAASTYHFKIHRRPGDALKDFAFGRLCRQTGYSVDRQIAVYSSTW
jgi:hypothetical protein